MSEEIKGLTIKFGANTVEFDNSVRGINKGLNLVNNEFKNINKQLKLDPTNVDLLTKKFNNLEQQQKATKALIEKYKDELNALDSAEVGSDKWRSLTKQIDNAETSLKQIESQSATTKAKLESVNKTSLSSLSASLDKAAAKVRNVGGATQDLGNKLMGVSATMTAMGGASMAMSLSFEDAMAKVHTIADTSQVPLKDLEKAIIDLSNETGVASSQIADDVYNAISAGQSTSDAINFVTEANKLSRAGFTDSAKALDVLTTTLNAYGLESSEVTNVSDKLIMTQNLGKTTVDELASSLGRVIPTANTYGVSLDQLSSAYAVMTSKGIATSETTTYLNGMLNELGKSGTKVSDALKNKTGKSFDELMESGLSLSDVLVIVNEAAEDQGLKFSDLFGSAEAAKAGITLLGDEGIEFNDVLKKMESSTGATETAFEKMQTKSLTLSKTIQTVKNMAISFGNTLLDMLEPALLKIQDVMKSLNDKFNGLDETQKRVIASIAGVIAIVGPVLVTLGGAINLVGGAMSGLTGLFGASAGASGLLGTSLGGLSGILSALFSPVGAIAAAIASAVLVFMDLYNSSETFSNYINEILSQVMLLLSSIFSDFGILINEVIIPIIQTLYNFIYEFLAPIFETVAMVMSETVMPALQGLWESISTNIIPIIVKLWEWLEKYIMPIFKTVASFLSDVFAVAFETLWNFITPVIDAIALLFGWIGDLFVILEDLGVFEAFGTVFEGIGTILSTVLDSVKSLVEWFGNLVSAVGDALGAMGEWAGNKWDDFTGWITGDDGNSSGGFGDINATIYIDNAESTVDAQSLISDAFVDILSEKLGRRISNA